MRRCMCWARLWVRRDSGEGESPATLVVLTPPPPAPLRAVPRHADEGAVRHDVALPSPPPCSARTPPPLLPRVLHSPAPGAATLQLAVRACVVCAVLEVCGATNHSHTALT